MDSRPSQRRRAGRRKFAERRVEIIETAIALADSIGLDRLTSREIGSVMGVAPGLIHHYFSTMDELTVAALEHHAGTTREELRQTLEALPPLPALCTYVVRMLEMTRSSARIWMSAWITGTRRADLAAEMVRQDQQDVALLADLLRRGQAVNAFRLDDPEASALRVLVVLDGITVQISRRSRDELGFVSVLMWDTVEREVGLPIGTLRPRAADVVEV
jgi:AcrR family transcriptional regulator